MLLQSTIAQGHQLRLNIHPDDLQTLRRILSESGVAWTERMELLLKSNAAVQPGEVRVEDHGASIVRIEDALDAHFSKYPGPYDPPEDLASTK